jgi:hypothetical protein
MEKIVGYTKPVSAWAGEWFIKVDRRRRFSTASTCALRMVHGIDAARSQSMQPGTPCGGPGIGVMSIGGHKESGWGSLPPEYCPERI